MNDKEFKLNCLGIVLTTAKGKKRSGNETAISKLGGYNRQRVFQAEYLIDMTVGEFFRLIMNIYRILQNREVFEATMRRLEDFIIDTAEKYGDEINAEHRRPQNKKKKVVC